jgi:hypothetical protein
MDNFFDQFDAPPKLPATVKAENYFDQFDSPSTAADVAKSGGIGLAKGAIGLGGIMGDIRHLAELPGEKLATYLGVDPEKTAALKNAVEAVTSRIGPLAGPSSADIQKGVEDVTGKLYEPKTTAGQYAQTVGEFLPAAATGPGGLVKRVVTQAVVPALASEAAGQVTEGTAAEPYARIAGALAGGAAPLLTAAKKAPLAVQEIKDAGSSAYKSPAVAAVKFDPAAVSAVADNAVSALKRAKLNERLAPQTHALLEDLKTPVSGAAHTVEDFETTRQLLGDLAGKFSDPVEQKAATQAIKFLDNYRANVPTGHVLAGDANLANQIITNGRADYAAAKTAEKVSEKIRNADLQAGSTYSGGNLNNATRQKLRPLLTSKSQGRGLTPDELQTIEDTVRGSAAGNVLRATGKFLGGGGGLGMLGSSAAGHAVAGPFGAFAAPAVGFVTKKIGDKITRANADKIVQQILSRSPTGIAKAAVTPPPTPASIELIRRALMASPATMPARLNAEQ